MKEMAMDLNDILSLRPDRGDSTTLRAAITRAELLRRDFSIQAADLARTRAQLLLTADDKTLAKAEQDAAAANLAVERIDALLPLMRDDLAKAEGAEALAALRAGAETVQQKVAALEAWQEKQLPKITAMMGEGFRLQDEAKAERDAYLERVRDAYSRPEVRNAGQLGVTVPPMPDGLPRGQFPNWHLT